MIKIYMLTYIAKSAILFSLVSLPLFLIACFGDGGCPMIRGYDYSLENQSQVSIKIKVYGQAKNEKNYCEEHEILPGEKAIYDKKISYEDYETLPVMDIFVTDGSRRCLTDSLMVVNAGVSYRGFLPYETDTLFYGDDDVSVKYTKHIVNDSILEYAVPCGE